MSESTLPEMLTTAEVGKRIRKSESTVRRMCARGELAAAKIGNTWLVPVDEVKRILTPVKAAEKPKPSPVKLAGNREIAGERLPDPDSDEHPRQAASRPAGETSRGDGPRVLVPRIIG